VACKRSINKQDKEFNMKRILLQISLVLICIYADAQQAFTNNGNLQIHTGGSVSGFGNFTNTGSGVLVNNGSVYVRGNITNDETLMAIGTGTLYLNGTAAQSVNGSQQFRTYNLETNNAAGFTLNNNLSVSGVHTFSSGLIASSAAPNYLIYEAGSSYTGSTDTRHVTGWVKKIGTTDFTFPVGDNTYERAAGIANLSASSEINGHYYTPTPNIFNLLPPLVRVDENEYWQIDRVSGGTAQIALNWNHAKVPFMNVLLSDVRVARYTTGNWTSAGGSAAGNVTTTGNITSAAVNTFGQFTFGSESFPLPVNIISLTAVRRTGVSFLKWLTGNEQNTDHFEVQRSYNAVTFATIGTVSGRNTGRQEEYNFEDPFSFQGIAYYRIRIVSSDNKNTYSGIAAVSEKELNTGSFVVLNPVRNVITIFNRTGSDGNFNYQLFNAGGQLITNGKVNMSSSGSAVIPVQLPAGVYLLEISDAKTMLRQRILVER
jgi:hypothetical protein